MINIYDNSRFISKSELARLAGVSPRTFSRYIHSRQHVLDRMGVSAKTQKLPPQAVRYLCEDYCIDLPEALQAPDAAGRSELYRRVLYELQKKSLFY